MAAPGSPRARAQRQASRQAAEAFPRELAAYRAALPLAHGRRPATLPGLDALALRLVAGALFVAMACGLALIVSTGR